MNANAVTLNINKSMNLGDKECLMKTFLWVPMALKLS